MAEFSIFSNIKASVSYLDALVSDPSLQACVVPGYQIRYAARRDCQSVRYDPIRDDAYMEEMLNVSKLAGLKWDPRVRNNLACAIKAIADKCSPVFCGPSNCPEVPANKKLWFQTDNKKLMAKCEIKSQDCCDDFTFWQELAGVARVPDTSNVFTGSSNAEPEGKNYVLWIQSDTDKFMKKIDVDGAAVWVEVS